MQQLKSLFKSAILATTLFLASQISVQAQSSLPEDFQLGIRLGDTFGADFAIDASMPFGGETLHTNIGFNDNLSLSALYDFVDTISPNLHWYYGFGAQVGFFDDFTVAAAAEIGIEYDIQEVPVTVGIDYRPALEIISETEFNTNQAGFFIRYRF